ncbi:hypothetical protein [Erwinia sp. E602]|uniref:hypothetical protein n=1 Tax=Erwinia sp. E602 TaxID=2675378 RepID=UPI001BA653BE|nr:hypothetical protein [Erwinia sp. E602]
MKLVKTMIPCNDRYTISNSSKSLNNDDATDYQKDLLQFIKEKRPVGTGDFDSHNLSKLMKMMKERYEYLYPGNSPSMSELSSTLLYVDATLRKSIHDEVKTAEEESLKNYVSDYLDKYTTQLIGANTLFESMRMNLLSNDEEEDF